VNKISPIHNLSVFILNDKSHIRFVSTPMAKILGYQSHELINKNINDAIIPTAYQKHLSDFISSEDIYRDLEVILQSKTDHLLNLNLKISRLKNSFTNTYSYLIVSDNLSFIDTLKNQINDLKDVYNKAYEYIILFDLNKNITFVNQKWLNKINPTPYPINQANLNTQFDKNTWDIINNAIDEIKTSNIVKNVLIRIKSNINGKVYHLNGSILLETKDNKPHYYQCILHNVTEEVRSKKVNNLYYNVTSQITKNNNLLSIYINIHKELKEVIECENFYIALFNPNDTENKTIEFPYFIDNGNIDKSGIIRPIANGITEYAVRNGKPLIISKNDLIKLKFKEIINVIGELPELWLGVPLSVSNKIIGVVAIQTYSKQIIYNQNDLQLLDFASSQIALAIEMARTNVELQNQTAKLNAIFDSSSHLIWSVNKNLDITSFNKNYLEANLSSYDATPHPIETNNDTNKTFKDFWAEKYEKAFKGEKLQFEIKLKNDKGFDVWKEIYLNPIYTGNNKIDEVSGIANDITLKKQSEFALLKSEEKFRNIFESFQDLYFRCDLKGHILMASPSVLDLIGYKPFEVIGKHIDDYYLFNPRVKKILKELRTEKNLKNVEVSIVKHNGEIRQCICNIRIVQNNIGEPFEIEGVVRDITQLKITNQQLIEANEITENSLRVKDQFLANMSHEIRTPMNGIIGMIDLLADSSLNTTQLNYIETLKKSSFILLEILNDILDLSKIEAGRMELKKSIFPLRQLIDKIHGLFSPIASTNQVKLHYFINKELPDYITTDETRLIQVLSNLISNSLKFTKKEGYIDVEFELLKQDEGRGIIRVNIKDSGIGISQENQKLLFTKFTQLDNSTTKSFAGTGLGLSISKQLVSLLGGEIGVKSNPGEGSTFWFTFNADFPNKSEIDDFEKDKNNNVDNNIAVNLNNFNVLIVDDNLINREVASKILLKAGCNVKSVSSGLEAIQEIKVNFFDIVFMDIQMPHMDGIETTKQIKKLPLTHIPKIIAMTAYALKEDKERFLNLGMDDYIAKPIRANALIDKIRNLHQVTDENQVAPSDSIEIIIDTNVIEQLKKYGGNDLISSVYDEFSDETFIQLEDCKHAAKTQQWNELKSLLHTIKGTSGTLGIQKIAKNSLKIENQLKVEDYSNLEINFSILLDNFDEYQESYKEIINKH